MDSGPVRAALDHDRAYHWAGRPATYRLRWHESRRQHGGSPAFSSTLAQIALPLNQPVELPVHIQIGEAGSYSAIVDLIDPLLISWR